MIIKTVGILFILIAAIIIIIARIKGFHNTEGELLVYYWQYWLSAIILIFTGGFLFFKPKA